MAPTEKIEIMDEKLNDLQELVRKNAESIHGLIRVTDKMEVYLEKVNQNANKLERLTEESIRREPVEERLVKLEATTGALERWKWMMLGAAALIGFMASLLEPFVTG